MLDWFNKKFVVFRAMHKKEAQRENKGYNHGVGVIPNEVQVVELLDD
jgi:hypothetical protein